MRFCAINTRILAMQKNLKKGLKFLIIMRIFVRLILNTKKNFAKDEKALAFICDGTGYGEDGKIWGGEVFVGNLKEYERIAHFEKFHSYK